MTTTAIDELLYAPRFPAYLDACRRAGITAIPAPGYQMISRTLPTSNRSLPDIIKRGRPDPMFSKLSLFDPSKLIETHRTVGRHGAAPMGEVEYPDEDVLLSLHFTYISLDHTSRGTRT